MIEIRSMPLPQPLSQPPSQPSPASPGITLFPPPQAIQTVPGQSRHVIPKEDLVIDFSSVSPHISPDFTHTVGSISSDDLATVPGESVSEELFTVTDITSVSEEFASASSLPEDGPLSGKSISSPIQPPSLSISDVLVWGCYDKGVGDNSWFDISCAVSVNSRFCDAHQYGQDNLIGAAYVATGERPDTLTVDSYFMSYEEIVLIADDPNYHVSLFPKHPRVICRSIRRGCYHSRMSGSR
jgi:hypothetical protein